MKKKILLARLNAFLEANKKVTSNNDLVKQISSKNVPENTLNIVFIHNFVERESIVDPDEREEVLEDIKTLTNPFGEVKDIQILESDRCVIRVNYSHYSEALSAVESLSGMVMGGRPLHVSFDEKFPNTGQESLNHLVDLDVSLRQYNKSSETVLKIFNMVSSVEIEDEDERNEVIENIRDICGGDDAVISIDLEPVMRHDMEWSCIDQYQSKTVILHYESIYDALLIASRLQGRVVGGSELSCEVIVDAFDASLGNKLPVSIPFHDVAIVIPPESKSESSSKLSDSANIDVSHFAVPFDTFNDFKHFEVGNGMKITHSKTMILSTGSSWINVVSIPKNSLIRFFDWFSKKQEISKVYYVTKRDSSLLENPNSVILSATDFVILDTEKVVTVSIDGYVSREDLQGVAFEEIIEMKQDLLKMVSIEAKQPISVRIQPHDGSFKLQSLSDIACIVRFKLESTAIEAMINLDGAVIGGQEIRSFIRCGCFSHDTLAARVNPELMNNNILRGTSLSSATLKDKNLDEKAESLYVQAVGIAHLPKRDSPCFSGIPMANDEINECVASMLNALATFQKRLKEKEPIKAKSKQRFVIGMKQSINAVKAGKVRLICLAPDTEIIDEVDEKLNYLVELCKSKEVPLIYCLNRRKLGKAIQASMRQTVIAVYDPDGAYEFFKKIIRFIESNSKG